MPEDLTSPEVPPNFLSATQLLFVLILQGFSASEKCKTGLVPPRWGRTEIKAAGRGGAGPALPSGPPLHSFHWGAAAAGPPGGRCRGSCAGPGPGPDPDPDPDPGPAPGPAGPWRSGRGTT